MTYVWTLGLFDWRKASFSDPWSEISICFSPFIKGDLVGKTLWVIHLEFTYLDLSTSSFGINIGNC